MNDECRKFWCNFVRHACLDKDPHLYEVFHFTDKKEFADYLARATVTGNKTGTSCLLWEMSESACGIVRVGDYSIVTYANDKPACVIETTAVEIVPFCEVDNDFAATEGEEDKSLAHWRECHWSEFEDKCREFAKRADETIQVVCETYRAVYVSV